MNIKQVFALTALTLAGGAVLADDAPGTPLTRAEVRQSVRDARVNHTLTPAGEAGSEEVTRYQQQFADPSTLTRADEKALVLQARAEGTLAHPGPVAPEEEMEYARTHPSTSHLTRVEVKKEVLQARADGKLVPPGVGGPFNGDTPAKPPQVFAHKDHTGDGVAATRGE